ncbi:helix-turn-helix domain-containing protein [Marinovum sp.]|uniref:helix-turn-helix transcriptional regulator n=1 Tax=Marinovum sp. TaxID=2024839 RepID=UPI002B26F47E|nr:helix-turn-helix domain-containing protein [Marinovum sp.]
MPVDLTPLAVREKTAAQMLDLKPADFRRLVEEGALPGPARIGDVILWRVADLEAILSGSAADPGNQEFEM